MPATQVVAPLYERKKAFIERCYNIHAKTCIFTEKLLISSFQFQRSVNACGLNHPAPTTSPILKIGRNMEITIPPITTPRKIIKSGSMSEVNPLNMVSTSSS